MEDYDEPKFKMGMRHTLYNSELRGRRLTMGLTQHQLEVLTGVARGMVSQIENFHEFPTNETAQKLANFFQVPVATLFPGWIKELVGKKTTIETEYLVTEKLLEHPELKLLPAEAGSPQQMEDMLDQDLLKGKMAQVIDSLSPREAKVIDIRFGLTDNQPKTLEETANIFFVTRERIRQIEAKAIRKLRTQTKSDGKFPEIREMYKNT